MESLIPINYEKEQPTISARDLHAALEIKTRFRMWFPRMCEYGFQEHTDYERLYQKCATSGGVQTVVDYEIGLDMAKHICMIQRNEKGMLYRQYFLELEKAWNSPDNVVNRSLERYGFDERVDHRSHAARGLDEQPTVHEGVTARALEAKGVISDRCELNRQIKWDNAVLREIKVQVKKLMQVVKNTIPALAEAMESVREKMIVFRYQLGHILTGKRRLTKSLDVMRPELERYTRIAGRIKEKSKGNYSV